jgi:CBS domain-containing protein
MKAQRSFVEPYAETLHDVLQERAVQTFTPDDKVPTVIRRLRANDEKVGAVVDDKGSLIGVVTEGTIIRKIFSRFGGLPTQVEKLCNHKAIKQLTAGDVMIAHPDTLHIDDTIENAMDLMTYFSHQCMPVVDSQKKLLGMIDIIDLRRSLEKKYGAIKSLEDPISLYALQQKLLNLNLGYSQAY